MCLYLRGGAGGPGEKDGVLANFFNSLLNKKPGPGAAGVGGARPSGTGGAGVPRTGTAAGAAPPSPRQTPVRPSMRPVPPASTSAGGETPTKQPPSWGS